MNSETELLSDTENFERKVFAGEIIVRYYNCPIKFCNLSRRRLLTILELVDHLRTFHQKPTLARCLVWFATKQQDQEGECK